MNIALIKWMIIAIAIISPFIMMSWIGELRSISAYWDSIAQPLFIFTNVTTSYLLFTTRCWKLNAILLLLVTAFSITLYPILHNIFAIAFFLVACWSFWQLRRFRWYLLLYLIAGVITIHNLLHGEVLAIIIISIYHAHVILYVNFLKKKH